MRETLSFISTLIICLVMGAISSNLARKRGRRSGPWFILGVLFGLISLLVLFILPKVKKVFKPKDKNEIDVTPVFVKSEEEKAAEENKIALLQHQEWFYLDKTNQQQGPIGFTFLKSLWSDGSVNEATFVWSEGMADWLRIKDVMELKSSFEG